MPRLYVGNVPSTVSIDDVNALVSRVCPVTDIYFPPIENGIHRGFAIVSVPELPDEDEEASSLSRKCISTLNCVHWKGSKLRVEMAKEYYTDRLERERAETARAVEEEAATRVECKTRHDQQTILKESIERVREGNICVPDEYRIKVRRGWYMMYKPRSGARKVWDDHGRLRVEKVESIGSTNDGTRSEYEHEYEHKPEADDEEKAAPAKFGAGVRKGFGTLFDKEDKKAKKAIKEDKENDTNNEVECCIDGTVESQRLEKGYDYGDDGDDDDEDEGWAPRNGISNAISEFDDGMDEDGTEARRSEIWIEAGDMDVVPAVAPEDVNEEALRFERSRMNKMMNSILAGGGDDANTVDTDNSRPEGGHSTANDIAPQATDRWAAYSGARFDPLAEDSSALELSATAVAALTSRDDAVVSVVDTTREDNGVEEKIGGKNYADLGELKGIFHREGGVWWGDGATLDGQVAKGQAPQDALFAEAEKLGVDVRDAGATTNSGDGMMFSFFDAGPVPAVEKDTATHGLAGGVTAATGTNHASNFESSGDIAVSISTLVAAIPSLSDLLNKAKLFSRAETEENIKQTWRDTRDKLVLDYKRRRLEARKRAAGVGEAVAAAEAGAAAEDAAGGQVKRWSRKRRGGAGNRPSKR